MSNKFRDGSFGTTFVPEFLVDPNAPKLVAFWVKPDMYRLLETVAAHSKTNECTYSISSLTIKMFVERAKEMGLEDVIPDRLK